MNDHSHRDPEAVPADRADRADQADQAVSAGPADQPPVPQLAHRSWPARVGLWVGLALAQLVLVGGLGLLLTHVWRSLSTEENGVNRWFVPRRTGLGNTVTDWLSHAADTGTIIAYVVLAGLVLRWVLHRWLESFVVALTVSTQAAIFLACTVLVKRPRPPVPKLDVSPPTSSYPSGHVGAATAFAVSLAVVIAWHQRHRLARWACVLLLAFPIAVAWSRLYRGMHHLSDVLMGGADGFLALTVTLVVLTGAVTHQRRHLAGGAKTDTSRVGRPTALGRTARLATPGSGRQSRAQA